MVVSDAHGTATARNPIMRQAIRRRARPARAESGTATVDTARGLDSSTIDRSVESERTRAGLAARLSKVTGGSDEANSIDQDP